MFTRKSMITAGLVLLSTSLLSLNLYAEEGPKGPPPEMNACMKEQLGEPEAGKRPSKADFEKARKACDQTKTEGTVCEDCEKSKDALSTVPTKLASDTDEILSKVVSPKDARLEKTKDKIVANISDFECDPSEDQSEDLKDLKPDADDLRKFAKNKDMLQEIKDAYREKIMECKKLAQKESRTPSQGLGLSGSAGFQQQLLYAQQQQQYQQQQYQQQQQYMMQQYQMQYQMQQYMMQMQMQQSQYSTINPSMMNNSMGVFGGFNNLGMYNSYGTTGLLSRVPTTSGLYSSGLSQIPLARY